MLPWLLYASLWALAAGIWSFAAAAGAGRSPLEALPYGALQMGIAGALGVAVIRLTRALPLGGERRVGFVVAHGAALGGFAALYATASTWPDLLRGDVGAVARSPVLGWNLLMGSWLYLVIAGIATAGRARREAAEARLLAQQAQLAALRAQLNPHFLFNALHTVSSLVAVDPAAADAAIERLGDLLRYALAEEELVPLASEWAFTGDYLELERLRLGERLRTDTHIDPAALRVMVPALLLQPIVENAVRHGVDGRPAGGTVGLSAAVDGDRLVLRVVDDGPGPGAGSPGNGVGLRAVRRRLDARHGERARVDVTAARGGGTEVTISLPADAP